MMGGSLGGSKSSSSNSYKQSTVQPQMDALQNLWSQAFGNLNQNSYGNQIGNAAGNMDQNYQQLLDQFSGITNQLQGGGAFGNSEDIRNKLYGMMGQDSQTGQMYNSIVGGQGNTYVDPLIDQLRSDSAQNLQGLRNQNAMSAADMGQSGSSRQAMEDAMMGAQANRDLTTQEAQLRQGAYDKDLSLKMGIAQQADSNRQSEQDRLYNMLSGNQSSLENAGNMGSLLSQLASGSMGGYLQAQQSQWDPYSTISNLIGSPIILGSGSGGSKSKGVGSSGGLFGG
jgi:hypothetical protein